MIRFLWQKVNRLWLYTRPLLLVVGLAVLLAPQWPAFGERDYQFDTIIQLRHFDFWVWEGDAFAAKLKAMLGNGHSYLPDNTRQQVVLDFLALQKRVSELNGQVTAVYVDPSVSDPDSASAELQAELATTRQKLAEIQPLAEAIVQDQVATILQEAGFAVLRQTWPPVAMHMTPLPALLIISPRDHVERINAFPLMDGLTVPAYEAMETAVQTQMNLSALVVPIGGMATYPAMIQETSSINWLAEVTAHEWTHHWLTLHPLGLLYDQNGDMRTINETVASLVGKEVGALVVARYYPEFVPPPIATPVATATAVATPAVPATPAAATPPPFDFRKEMAETRIQADALLAQGEIVRAETYMEARRRFFVANGYSIRKLNQAYFAFYGAYADTPGATGGDPIGPLLVALRAQTPDLHTFLESVSAVRSLADLQALAPATP